MALTEQQWYDKIKTWLPSWFFEQETYQRAHLMALSKLLSQLQGDAEAHVAETMLAQADSTYLDAHGSERSVDRVTGELDPQYSSRIRNIINLSNVPSLKALVDGILVVAGYKGSIIQDHMTDPPACSRGTYCGRGKVFAEDTVNHFSVVVPLQGVPIASCLQSIQVAVDAAKALGSLYRIIELNKSSL